MKQMLTIIILAGAALECSGIAQQNLKPAAAQGEPARAVRVEATVDVQLRPEGTVQTHVSVTHPGWKQGPEWDQP
jgi:hypothetical protein